MSTILFFVFSGQASGIFDKFLIHVHKNYVGKKTGQDSVEPPNVFAIETQWDNGGHTGYMNEFYEWLAKEPEFQKEAWKGFRLPPPMGDLKPQISRWSKDLLPDEFKKTISGLIGNRHTSLDLTFEELKVLISNLKNIAPHIFTDETKMNFLSTFINSYREFAQMQPEGTSHAVGNLFLSFLYFYSYLIREEIDLPHDHHHQIFFNFLKDLSLVPRGTRFEFLIDGRYNLTAKSHDGTHIPTEKQFDEYNAPTPVDPHTYNIESVIPGDIEDQFEDLFERSDIVVIPPGSLSNWMPLLNKFHKLLATKPVIWIINSFHHVSEVSLREQIEYVKTLGINPIILAPVLDNPFEGLSEITSEFFFSKYQEEGKSPENFTEAFEGHGEMEILRCIPLNKLEANDGGIKYDPNFIDAFLFRLSEILNSIDEVTIELVKEKSNYLAIEMNKEFKNVK